MILFFISRAAALVRFVFCSLRACLKLNLILQLELVLNWLTTYIYISYHDIFRAYFLYCNPLQDLSTDKSDSTNNPVCLCSYFCPNRPVLKYRAEFKTAGKRENKHD